MFLSGLFQLSGKGKVVDVHRLRYKPIRGGLRRCFPQPEDALL